MLRRDPSGVTLVELSVLLLILGILAALPRQAAGILQGARGARKVPPTRLFKPFATRDSARSPMPKTTASRSASSGVSANTRSRELGPVDALVNKRRHRLPARDTHG
jgi:hypothetical protein